MNRDKKKSVCPRDFTYPNTGPMMQEVPNDDEHESSVTSDDDDEDEDGGYSLHGCYRDPAQMREPSSPAEKERRLRHRKLLSALTEPQQVAILSTWSDLEEVRASVYLLMW